MWAAAKNVVSTLEGSLLAFEAIARLTHKRARIDALRDAAQAGEALDAINEIVVTVIETTQGKLNGDQLINAVRVLIDRLDAGDLIPVAMERMRSKI